MCIFFSLSYPDESCEFREKRKSASLLCISSEKEKEMQLKNRSHVATQTSLEEAARSDEQQVYDTDETGRLSNLECGGDSAEATVERKANESDNGDAEIIDNDESGKED